MTREHHSPLRGKQLIKHRRRKIILIIDNLSVHHAIPVKAWIEEHRERIEGFYLPAYIPELNPDEYLNNDLKQTIASDGVATTHGELDAQVSVTMFMLSIRRYRVSSFFHHPKAKYAA